MQKWISADDYELITSNVKIPTYVTDSGDVEKAVGHVTDSVAEKHYKINEEYIRRLALYIEQLGTMFGNAKKAV